jgi:hypothetical protein
MARQTYGDKTPEWVFCNEEGNHLNEFLFRMRKFYPFIKAIKMRSSEYMTCGTRMPA